MDSLLNWLFGALLRVVQYIWIWLPFAVLFPLSRYPEILPQESRWIVGVGLLLSMCILVMGLNRGYKNFYKSEQENRAALLRDGANLRIKWGLKRRDV